MKRYYLIESGQPIITKTAMYFADGIDRNIETGSFNSSNYVELSKGQLEVILESLIDMKQYDKVHGFKDINYDSSIKLIKKILEEK